MRNVVLAAIAFAVALVSASGADARILITIDKSTQRMTVSVDGATRWTWPVSTGRAGHATPAGEFKAFRLERDHYSREWDDAPMPHSIFFTKRGHAIHGSLETRRLGSPASAGCVRLHPDNARELFALVEQRGVTTATVVITGTEPRVSAPAVAKRTQRKQQQPEQQELEPPPQQQTSPRLLFPQQTAPQPRTVRRAPQYDDEVEYVNPRNGRSRNRPQPGYEHLPPPPPGYRYVQPPPGYYDYYR